MRIKSFNKLLKPFRSFSLRDALKILALFCRCRLSIFAHFVRSLRYALIVLACMTFTMTGVQAQTAPNFDPPDLKLVDNVGVNLISGKAQFHSSPVHIGPKDTGLTFTLNFNGSAVWVASADSFAGEVYQASNWPYYDVAVNLFNKSDVFRGGATTDLRETGSTLNIKADGSYEYVSRGGVRYITNPAIQGWHNENGGVNMAITKVVYPSGYEINISRSALSGTRVQSVTTNYGYQLRYSYDPTGQLINVTAVNLAVDYCDPAAANCSYSRTWPFATFLRESSIVALVGPTTLTTTDSANKITKYFTQDGFVQTSGAAYHYSRLTSVKWPSSPSAANVTLGYGTMLGCKDGGGYWACDVVRDSLVTSADIGAGHWTYSYTEQVPGAPPYPHRFIHISSQNG